MAEIFYFVVLYNRYTGTTTTYNWLISELVITNDVRSKLKKVRDNC